VRHLDCHGGPFLVVFLGNTCDERTIVCVYSSEEAAWGDTIYAEGEHMVMNEAQRACEQHGLLHLFAE
jgi:hypothetical protein